MEAPKMEAEIYERKRLARRWHEGLTLIEKINIMFAHRRELETFIGKRRQNSSEKEKPT